jgi:hypothetical protein
MNKLCDRFHTGMGFISMGSLLTAALGIALADRALHPVDTYRDIQKRRAATRSRSSQGSTPPTRLD